MKSKLSAPKLTAAEQRAIVKAAKLTPAEKAAAAEAIERFKNRRIAAARAAELSAAAKNVAATSDTLVRASALKPDELFLSIPLACLDDSPTQPRTHYDTAKHEELCASFREHGWVSAWPAMVREKAGPGVICEPVDPSHEEGPWALRHPETRTFIDDVIPNINNLTREDAERLASTTYAKRYEIVFGHRRTRAAHAASLKFGPCIVRKLTDPQVLELQLIENIQRDDLNPIDQAEHLRRIFNLRDESGSPVYSKESLALKIGVSRMHIKNTLSLCSLDGISRDAVLNGELGVSIAYEIAVIPNKLVRESAAAEIINPSVGEGPMTLNEAIDYIRRNCTRNLRDVKFDRNAVDLVPVIINPEGLQIGGGDCSSCPMNSSNAEEGREDRKRAFGLCGNIACFEQKTAIDFERFRAQHNKPEAGKLAVSYERNVELFDDMGELDWKSGLVPLNEPPAEGFLKPDHSTDSETPDWSELTDGKLSEVIVARHPKTGKRVELVPIEQAKEAAEQNGHFIFKTSKTRVEQARQSGNTEEHKAATLAAKHTQDAGTLVGEMLADSVASKVEDISEDACHLLPGKTVSLIWKAASLICLFVLELIPPQTYSAVMNRRKGEKGYLESIAAQLNGASLGLLFELLLTYYYTNKGADIAITLAALFGVKIEKIREDVELKLSKDKKTPPPIAPIPAPSSPGLPSNEHWSALKFTPAALADAGNAFLWGDIFECYFPDILAVALPSTEKHPLTVELYAAATSTTPEGTGDVKWYAGYSIKAREFGVDEKPISSDSPFRSRFAAFAASARTVLARLQSDARFSLKVQKTMEAAVSDLNEREKAENLACEETDGTALASSGPSHFAYIELTEPDNLRVIEWSPELFSEIANDLLTLWICPIAGMADFAEAEEAAAEALRNRAGTVTAEGLKRGFDFNIALETFTEPDPFLI